MRLEYLIAYSSIASVLIPLAIALVQWRALKSDLKLLTSILVLSFSSDMISFLLVQYSLNTYLVINIFLIAQSCALVLIFMKQSQNPKIMKIILLSFTAFSITNISFFQGPWVFNSVSNTVGGIILIGFCMVYFYRLLNELPIVHVQRLPMLWIAFAVLTYYGGNFFLFLVKNYLTYGEAGSHKLMWILHNLLNIIKNFLFAVGLWQSYRKVKSSTLSVSAH